MRTAQIFLPSDHGARSHADVPRKIILDLSPRFAKSLDPRGIDVAHLGTPFRFPVSDQFQCLYLAGKLNMAV